MTFRRTAPAVLIAATIVMVATISMISALIARQMTASFEEAQFELMSRVMTSGLGTAEMQATAGAEWIAALPPVRKAFASRNREELLAITKDAFALQRDKYGLSQAQFHTPDIKSFLRVHNPSKFGEDLAGYRQIVVEANESKAIRRGIEITTSGVGIFGTVPVTDPAGKHAGTFETALEFGPLLDGLKKTYGFELAVFIDEKALRATATSLGGDVLSPNNRVGKYVLFHATHPDLLRSLVTDGDINVTEDANYVRDGASIPYGVLLQPVYNFAKKQIGVVAVVKNFSAMQSAGGNAVLWQLMLGLISAVVLIGFILVVIRGMLLQPLAVVGERFAALAAGDTSQPIPEAQAMCTELQDLAASYESLRQKAQPSGPTGEQAS
jgi:methyl-accepting chemotaxis protein